MASKDYYAILGVSRDASADEIKRAYRVLARQLHPDVSKAPDAAKRFAEVQNAYDVLSDASKRRAYDQFGEAGVGGAGVGGAGVDGAGVGAGPFRRGSGVRINVPPGMDFDADEIHSMFETFFGGAGRAEPAPGRRKSRGKQRPDPPAATTAEIEIEFRTAALGGEERLRVRVGGLDRTLTVTIPPGVADGSQLRLSGQGEDGGDLLLTVRVKPHAIFRRGDPSASAEDRRRSADLYLDLPLTIAEATLGATVRVPTLSGSAELSVPAGTPSGRRLRLKGLGIRADGRSAAGDLYAVVQVVPPAASGLSAADRAALQRMCVGSPRTGPGWE